MITDYRVRNPLLRSTDVIKIVGYNGDECIISGPGMGDWGPVLAPYSTGLFTAPFKTNWVKSMLGQKFSSWQPLRRDIAATIHILNPRDGTTLERDPDLWHLIYSRFRNLFHREYESQVHYISVDGERRLGIREVQDPKPFVGAEFEGRDPHIFCYGSLGMLFGCENPYYVGATESFAWETSDLGDDWFTLPYYNPSSVMIWPRWLLTDRAEWTLPDYSFGWEEFGTGLADIGKTVQLPLLVEGENIEVDSRPDMQTIIAENGNPVHQRLKGRDLEYPIQPGEGDPVAGCTVRVRDISNPDGARAELFLPRWYSEPFSTPTIVAPALESATG